MRLQDGSRHPPVVVVTHVRIIVFDCVSIGRVSAKLSSPQRYVSLDVLVLFGCLIKCVRVYLENFYGLSDLVAGSLDKGFHKVLQTHFAMFSLNSEYTYLSNCH